MLPYKLFSVEYLIYVNTLWRGEEGKEGRGDRWRALNDI